jgi:hypothetical protein
MKASENIKLRTTKPGVLEHNYNTNYLGGGGKKIMSSRPRQQNW